MEFRGFGKRVFIRPVFSEWGRVALIKGDWDRVTRKIAFTGWKVGVAKVNQTGVRETAFRYRRAEGGGGTREKLKKGWF